MSDDQKSGISIDELLKQAIDKTNGEITYANTLGVSIGENEVILEFYFMLPVGSHHGSNKPNLLQRVVFPLKLGLQLAQMLDNGIRQVENQLPKDSNL